MSVERARASGSLGEFLGALRITSLGSLVTIAFGMVTTKIVALTVSAAGIALLGVYRQFSQVVVSLVPCGMNNLLMQRVSTAKSRTEILSLIEAARVLLLIQVFLVLVMAVVAAPSCARLLFGAAAAQRVVELRWLLVVNVGMLLSQAVIAILSGQRRVRDVTSINVIMSASTLVTAYPFLQLAHAGLPLVIGGTCFVGATFGIYRMGCAGSFGWADLRWPSLNEVLRRLPPSGVLVAQPLIVTLSGLAVQALLARRYGLELLGYYNAASLVEGTAVLALTSSMHSYYLPTFGRLSSYEAQRAFADRSLTTLIGLVAVGCGILILGSPFFLGLLFSRQLVGAWPLVAILCLSIIWQMVVWCHIMFLIHKGDFRSVFWLDSTWATLRLVGTLLCIRLAAPIVAVAWVYVGSYVLSAAFYSVRVRLRYGSLIRTSRLLLGAAIFIFLLLIDSLYGSHALRMGVP